MAFLGKAPVTGYLDPIWKKRQDDIMSDTDQRALVNGFLTPLGSFDEPLVHIPHGIFVACTPTTYAAGGYYYRPTYHGMSATYDDLDTYKDVYNKVLFRHQSLWTKYAIVGVPQAASVPQNLYDFKDTRYFIVNTGKEALRANDTFIVEPPSRADSQAQIFGYKNSTRSQQLFNNCDVLPGGLAATTLIPTEITSRMRHVMSRDVGLCTDYGKELLAQNNMNPLVRVVDTPSALGEHLKSSIFTTTIDLMDTTLCLVSMMKRLTNLPDEAKDIIKDYHNYVHHGAPLDPKTLVEIWKHPEIADLFQDSMDVGITSLRRLMGGTFGTVLKFSEMNPTPIRDETIVNAYGGQYMPGELFVGVVRSFNGD